MNSSLTFGLEHLQSNLALLLAGRRLGAGAAAETEEIRSITISMSSEKRAISFHAVERDVPPLNVRRGPHWGRPNNSRKVQHPQKSFSTLAFTPVLAVVLLRGGWNPVPFLLGLVDWHLITIGSIANLIVIEAAAGCGVRIGFREHARVGVPVTVASLVVLLAWTALAGGR
jgi:hypothetical protein